MPPVPSHRPRSLSVGREAPGTAPHARRADSLETPPKEAFAAVPYHGHWFLIADTDIRSKATFGAVMLLFSILDVGAKVGGPIVTVPTTR